jgi:hypothetical protein
MTKKALIDPNTIVSTDKVRVAQVVEDGQEFTVAQPLYWTDCPDDCLADEWDFDTVLNVCIKKVTTAQQNKDTAIGLLQETDWATIADVANPNLSIPYLTNQQEFISYRNQIRPYAINPVEGDIEWPIQPKAIWSNT